MVVTNRRCSTEVKIETDKGWKRMKPSLYFSYWKHEENTTRLVLKARAWGKGKGGPLGEWIGPTWLAVNFLLLSDPPHPLEGPSKAFYQRAPLEKAQKSQNSFSSALLSWPFASFCFLVSSLTILPRLRCSFISHVGHLDRLTILLTLELCSYSFAIFTNSW